MSCCSDSKGSCCGQPQSLPWFSAVCDPVFRGKLLARYGRELLLGALAGGIAGGAALLLGDRLGVLGPWLGGPWLHLHAAAVLPAAALGGMIMRTRLAAAVGTLAVLALGGALNGFLEASWVSVPVFAVLGLPLLWVATCWKRG
jgi:hypothetical protein